MTTSDLNQETSMPHRVTLGDVLNSIEMTPGEMSTFLGALAQNFQGTAHNNLYRLLNDHAAMVADPQTYGYRPPEMAANAPNAPYEPPTAPRYAQRFGGGNVDAGVAAEQRATHFGKLDNDPSSNVSVGPSPLVGAPAAQGQSTTFETIRTGKADASRNQDPAAFPVPAVSPAVGDPGASIGGVPLSDDERRQYNVPQGSAMDRAAAQQKEDEIADLRRQLAEARGQQGTPTDEPQGFKSVRSEATAPQDIP